MSLATKHVATVLVGSALVLALSFAFVTPAKADLLSDLQAQVQALLAQISTLGGSSMTTSGVGCYAFTKTQQQGDSGGEVMWVQKFLNSHGAQIAASGAGSPGNETSYFGALTKNAVAKWQAANGVSPAAGYWGPVTRAKVASVCGSTTGGGGTTVPVTGNGLKVMLSADSPASTALVQGQAIGDLAHYTFSNPTGSAVTVTSLGFKRIGVSSDSTILNVYLFNGATRITDSAGLSSGAFTFNDSSGIFQIPAGGTVTIAVRADISAGTNGQQVGVQLVSVGSAATLDSSVVLPITGSTHLIASASLGTVTLTYTGPTNSTDNASNDVRVFEAQTNVNTHAAWLQGVTFEDRGTDNDGDLRNFRLYVDGVQVGSAVAQASNQKITFDLGSNPKRLETGTRIIKVLADVVSGSNKTYDIQIRRAADIMVVDAELNQAILSTDTGGSFPVSAATANTIGQGGLSIVKKADSPTDNIAVGSSNVLLARYEVRASGENVKIEQLTATTTTTGLVGLDNGKVFLNGVQIGSTQDIAASPTGTTFTFGSSFIARAGMVEILEIYADAKKASDSSNLADGNSILVGVSVAAADTEGTDSGDAVSAITNVVGNARTVSASTATLSKASGYGNQTMVAGTSNAKMGSFTISAGSTEGVNVNTLTLNFDSAAGEAASVTDLMLKDHDTGAQIGSTKTSPGSSNSFSVNLAVPKSGTKTVDVYANIKSSAASGNWAVDVVGSGTGAITAQTVNLNSQTLQLITIANGGSLAVTRDPGTPVNANVVAGLTQVRVGKFSFAAANSWYTIQELKVKIPSDAATSVSGVTLKYKDQSGVDQTVSTSLVTPQTTESYATATFQGLSFYVPMNDSATVDVYVDVPTVASGAHSGAAISAALDWNEGFKAIDGAGNQSTTFGTADVASNSSTGYGTMYVKKSVPTLARLTTGYTSNTVAPGIGLYRFTMTADSAGAVEWRKLSFTVATSSTANLSGFTLYDVTGSAVAVNTNPVTTFTNNVIVICPGTSCVNGEAEQVGSGSTKTYELRASSVPTWTAGGTLTINFTDDTSPVVNTTSLLQNGNMVWSDRSANSHTTTTSDWTNGYLVKDMDNDTRSCQISSSATTCTP